MEDYVINSYNFTKDQLQLAVTMIKHLTDATGAPANDQTVSLILTELSEGTEYANCDKIQAQCLPKVLAEYREVHKERVFWEKETRKLFTRWADKQIMGERVQATPMEGTEKEGKVPEEAPKSPTKTKKRVRFADPVPETSTASSPTVGNKTTTEEHRKVYFGPRPGKSL